MFKRTEQVNHLIQKELSKIILKELDLPKDVLVTVTRVETTPNLTQASVFLSVLPEGQTEKTLSSLNRQIYNLQQIFNKRVKMRPTPRLIFANEERTKEAGRIEEILEEIKKENMAR